MPQVLTRRSEPIHPSSQARSPAPTNPKTGSGSDHPGGRSPQSHCSISPSVLKLSHTTRSHSSASVLKKGVLSWVQPLLQPTCGPPHPSSLSHSASPQLELACPECPPATLSCCTLVHSGLGLAGAWWEWYYRCPASASPRTHPRVSSHLPCHHTPSRSSSRSPRPLGRLPDLPRLSTSGLALKLAASHVLAVTVVATTSEGSGVSLRTAVSWVPCEQNARMLAIVPCHWHGTAA